jgi:hypothetical protein
MVYGPKVNRHRADYFSLWLGESAKKKVVFWLSGVAEAVVQQMEH